MSEYGHIFQLGYDWTESKQPLKNRYTVIYENKDYYVCVSGGDTYPKIIRKDTVYSLESMHYAIEHNKYSFDTFRYVFVKKAKDFDIELPTISEKYLNAEIKRRINDINDYRKYMQKYQDDIQDKQNSINRCSEKIEKLSIELDKLQKLYLEEIGRAYNES